MMHHVRSIIFIYVKIVICLPYTFAPWTMKPIPPTSGTMLTCYDWLKHHRFTDSNNQNRTLAYSRITYYDQEVSYFAAAFAYVIATVCYLSEIDTNIPSIYCQMHTLPHVTYPFIPLKDAEFICEGWIDLYLYPANRDPRRDLGPNMNIDNYIWARTRNESLDNRISLWAALYFKYLTCDRGNAYTKPRDFCILMRQPVLNTPLPRNCPFMTFDGSRMSCNERTVARESHMLAENVAAERYFADVPKLPFSTLATECHERIIRNGFANTTLTNYNLVIGGLLDESSLNPFAKEYVNYVKKWNETHQSNKQEYEYLLQIFDIISEEAKEEAKGRIEYLKDMIDITLTDTPHNELYNAFMAPKEFCNDKDFDDTEIVDYFINFF